MSKEESREKLIRELQDLGQLIAPDDGRSSEADPLEDSAPLPKPVTDTYDDLCHGRITSAKLSEADACSVIARGRGSQFDPEVVDVFLQMRLAARPVPEKPPRLVRTEELRAGMRLARDLVSPEGLVLLSAGHVIQADLIRRLKLREARDNSPYNLYVTHD